MTFEEAIIISVRKYYQGQNPEELMNVREGEMKYTREYFDELEEELLGSGKKGKKKKEEEDEEVEYEFD